MLHRNARREGAVLGIVLILAAFATHRWGLEYLFERRMERPIVQAVIWLFQGSCLLSGTWLLYKRPLLPISTLLRRAVGVCAIVGLSASVYGNLKMLEFVSPYSFEDDRQAAKTWKDLDLVEELHLALGTRLRPLSRGVKDLGFPEERSRLVFAEQVRYTDLSVTNPPSYYAEFMPTAATGIRHWQLDEEQHSAARDALSLWRPFLDRVKFLHWAKFKLKKSHFVDDDTAGDFETLVLFHALAQMKTGELAEVHGSAIALWRRDRPTQTELGQQWSIFDWRLKSFETIESDGFLFADVTDQVLSEPAMRARARGSEHEKKVLAFLKDKKGFQKPNKRFEVASNDRHSSVAIVDIDRDGFDDIFLMDRWSDNVLLHNQGDGTFKDIAPRLGLSDFPYTVAALFADFDNDGDTDVFLGRTFVRSTMLMNEDGKFQERPNDAFPFLAVSIAAADYDGDGLLDFYVSTEAAFIIDLITSKKENFPSKVLKDFLTDADAKELSALLRSPASHRNVNFHGPPNVLLHNIGGGNFEQIHDTPLKSFRNSFQATWSDYDQDGDQDMYVANDLSSNSFFRNDGNGTFVEITQETNTADNGFGMGVTWGDYDNDGHFDMYISNMYSKAGQRITAYLEQRNITIDRRFSRMARGNSLFHAQQGSFEQLAGLEAPAMQVELGGWSWGSQFVDVDNDGYLDIVSLSGYFTAPGEVARDVDL